VKIHQQTVVVWLDPRRELEDSVVLEPSSPDVSRLLPKFQLAFARPQTGRMVFEWEQKRHYLLECRMLRVDFSDMHPFKARSVMAQLKELLQVDVANAECNLEDLVATDGNGDPHTFKVWSNTVQVMTFHHIADNLSTQDPFALFYHANMSPFLLSQLTRQHEVLLWVAHTTRVSWGQLMVRDVYETIKRGLATGAGEVCKTRAREKGTVNGVMQPKLLKIPCVIGKRLLYHFLRDFHIEMGALQAFEWRSKKWRAVCVSQPFTAAHVFDFLPAVRLTLASSCFMDWTVCASSS